MKSLAFLKSCHRQEEKGIPVISEIEFAAPFTNAVTIGITGSNGKTTTTKPITCSSLQIERRFRREYRKSFAWQVAEENFESYVLELSSFQLDGIVDYKPHIAIITNISPDHLDRYDYKYENYIDSKFRIT
jgi:UDP-N-acetylmuramoylalanine--D-glutamate ligase